MNTEILMFAKAPTHVLLLPGITRNPNKYGNLIPESDGNDVSKRLRPHSQILAKMTYDCRTTLGAFNLWALGFS